MKKTVLLIVTILMILTACSPMTESTEVVVDTELRDEINRLSNQLKFAELRTLFRDKMDEGLSDTVALQNYGFIEYKIFQDYETAITALERAIALEPQNASLHVSLGEAYLYQGSYDSAVEALKTALDLKEDFTGEWNDEISRIYYLTGKSYRALSDNVQAITNLESSLQCNPYRSEANMLLHLLYVEQENYDKAYETWKLENRIIDGTEPFLTRTAQYNALYSKALADGAGHREMAELYLALNLYDEALLEYTKASEEAGDGTDIISRIARIETFIEFRDELVSFFEDYYRKRCQGGAEFNDYANLLPIYSEIAPLVGEEELVGGTKSWLGKVNEKIKEEFGFCVEFVMSNGVLFGLHFGYIADDINEPVSQWGTNGEFRLIVVKNMASNGLFRWLSDGSFGAGGWNLGDGEMYAVLESTTLISTVDFLDESKLTAMRQQAAVEYEESLNKDPAAIFFFPSLVSELTASQVNAEREKAASAGLSPEQLRTFVVNRYQDSLLFTTIVHEGQHALDSNFTSTKHGEYEYRAKLSELAYGDMQYRALGNMQSPALDTDASDTHTVANKQVFQDIVQYILENQDQFPEINTAQNIMVQLHKLSQEQIKQIAISIYQSNYPEELYQ